MEKRNGNKQENEVSWMKLLGKITKWFFNTTKIEVNTDWRLVALEEHQKWIETEEKLQQAMQTIADKDKIIEIYKEKAK